MEKFLDKAIGVPWIDKGRDFTGWDCWGLIYCYYRDVLDIVLPVYGDISCNDSYLACKTTITEAKKWTKIEVPFGTEQKNDILLWRPMHTGLVLRPGLMLHCLTGTETVKERYDNMLWRNQLAGVYRYDNLS